MENSSNITIIQTAPLVNTKASEEYIQVVFSYPDVKSEWRGWVPIEYRRTGVSIARDNVADLMTYLESIYAQLHPSNTHHGLNNRMRIGTLLGLWKLNKFLIFSKTVNGIVAIVIFPIRTLRVESRT